MAESPPGGPKDQPPLDSGGRRLMMFDEQEEAKRSSGRPRLLRSFVRIVILLAAVAVTLWAARSFLDGRPTAPLGPDSFTARPAEPVLAPPADTNPEISPTEVEAPLGTTVEVDVGARDESGELLPDTLLRFVVESGTGTLEADTARTDSTGIARALITLGPRPASTVLVAEVVGAELPPQRITVTGRAGPPQRIAKVAGDQQVTDVGALVEGLVIRVTDAGGNPVPGEQVFFQPAEDNGLVAPSRIRTDSLGLASARWRLAATAGVQRLRAEVAQGEVPPVTFTATARGDTADATEAEQAREDTVETPSLDTVPPPTVEPPPVTVVRRTFGVGGTFVCGISAGRAACRGANDRGQLGGGGGDEFEGLAVGVAHACALDASGVASCWGANDGGQLGDGSRTDRTSPVRVETELRFSMLTAGAGHTCGLVSGGRVACWGRNLSGQLGDGTREDRSMPTPLPGNRSFRNLVAGWEHTCGLGDGGELACWGGNGQGQLGDGSRLDRLSPARVPGTFESVAAGSRHTCGISGDQVLCWGDNSFGQLGDESTQARTQPTAVSDLPARPVRLTAGAVHTCALLEDGAAWCWGQNVHGQLGDGTNENRAEPSPVAGDLTFTSLFAGGALTCGFTTDGGQYCWGLNQTGQLGDGTRDNRASPSRVGG